MINRKIKAIGEWLEDLLRSMCGALSPDRRIVVVLTSFLLFAALSLYITFSTFYHLGKERGNQLYIKHIEQLDLEVKQRLDMERITHSNDLNYDSERKTE